MDILKRQAAVTGVGQSATGRRLGRSGISLTVEAAMRAIEDAGLDRKQVDGIATGSGYAPAPGADAIGTGEIKDAMGLPTLNWYASSSDSTQMSALLQATMAVATGQARHVLVFRTVTEASARADALDSAGAIRVDGSIQWRSPFNAPSAANWVALAATRYMHEFGLTREQLSAIALNGRRNAILTPGAVYRTPLSFDDYMGARQISSPLCLYDCDVPMDGSVALMVSHRDAAKDLRAPPVWIEAICGPFVGRDTWDQQPDLTRFTGSEAGRRLWSRTDFRPADVDVAQLYDGFSFLALLWLEDLGFCPRGEAGRFIEGGQRIALDGELPMNTSGGQLSFGRLHGLGLVHEACVQLRGLGGERQVAGDPRVAVATNGGGPVASAVLLTRD